MGKIKPPPRAKLIAAVMVSSTDLFTNVKHELEHRYGPIDLASDIYSFTFTSYYNEEMGEGLEKQVVSFDRLIDKETLAATKIESNHIEEHYAIQTETGMRRRVNIDPGYVDDSKLVLASTKDFSHRVYIGEGIFAEVTLRYLRKAGFQALEWTYPDYRTKQMRSFLDRIRNRYMEQDRSV